MRETESYYSGLRCRECGKAYPREPLYVCEECFGPLDVEYDYRAVASVLSKDVIAARPQTMWRYRELLPIEKVPPEGSHSGFTPLVRSERLARRLGVREVWIKNDGIMHPSLSFKDRVVSVAIATAVEAGYDTIACASTGNLANAVAANSAQAGLRSFVLIPDGLEAAKVLGSRVYGANVVRIAGTYDDAKRLASEIADRFKWAFVNINFYPYYAEGSKTMGYEIIEQLGWRVPDHVVVPMAGGTLITRLERAFNEFRMLGFVDDKAVRLHGAQAEGCSPIVEAFKNGVEDITPVQTPDTLVKSLAIGDPGDGYYALRTIKNTGGSAENPCDDEAVDGVKMLAECSGIFAETAGGIVVSAARRLIENDTIGHDDSVVLCITGNGVKTSDALGNHFHLPGVIEPNLENFEEMTATK